MRYIQEGDPTSTWMFFFSHFSFLFFLLFSFRVQQDVHDSRLLICILEGYPRARVARLNQQGLGKCFFSFFFSIFRFLVLYN